MLLRRDAYAGVVIDKMVTEKTYGGMDCEISLRVVAIS